MSKLKRVTFEYHDGHSEHVDTTDATVWNHLRTEFEKDNKPVANAAPVILNAPAIVETPLVMPTINWARDEDKQPTVNATDSAPRYGEAPLVMPSLF